MRKILIFTLFLFACREATITPYCEFVTISDALPVQFWLSECQTYNEFAACGVHHKCWCQPWQCDDEIKIQFTDIQITDYFLSVVNDEGTELVSLPFIKPSNELTNGDFSSGLTGWSQVTLDTWTSDVVSFSDGGGFAEATLAGALIVNNNTQVIGQTVVDDSKSYLVSANFGINAVSNDTNIVLGIYIILYSGTTQVSAILVHSFTQTQDSYALENYEISNSSLQGADSIGIVYRFISNASSVDMDVSIDNVEVYESPVLYETSLIPSDYDICDQQIQLKIFEGDSPETEVAKSDCLDIRTNHECTNVITYSNTRNFAGLIYQDLSPDDEFHIRVPSIFVHEQSDQEDETIELVSSIITLSGELKWKRLFEVDYVPYYFHKKLQLIFMHQFITINTKSWVKKDAYEIVEGDRRSALKKGKVFLNEKNFVHRNTL